MPDLAIIAIKCAWLNKNKLAKIQNASFTPISTNSIVRETSQETLGSTGLMEERLSRHQGGATGNVAVLG